MPYFYHTVEDILTLKKITASIIQGFAIGPLAYVVSSAGDLQTMDPSSQLVKFADNTYIIIPAYNYQTRTAELRNIET